MERGKTSFVLGTLAGLWIKRGIRFLMSNSSAQFIKEIYQDFTVHVVKATRSINSKGSGRSGIDELLICNYTV